MGKISITPSSVVKIAKVSMTPEQEYYYLLENDIEFKEYINSIKVSNNNPANLTFYNQPNATREGRWASFETIEAEGHDISSLIKALEQAKTIKNKPQAIIAHTIKGAGVSFMENNVKWHGVTPKEDEYNQAIEELDTALGKI
jgi:transketolase